jgi:hypothetical protein
VIAVAAPCVNLDETFQDQRTIVNVLRNGHQIDGMLRFADGQIFLAQSSIDLSEDSNRPRVFWFDDQSLGENFSTFAKRSCRKLGMSSKPRQSLAGEYRRRLQEIISDNLSQAGWSLGCVATVDGEGKTIWIADAHRDDGKRLVVRADEKLTAFLELESATQRFAPPQWRLGRNERRD